MYQKRGLFAKAGILAILDHANDHKIRLLLASARTDSPPQRILIYKIEPGKLFVDNRDMLRVLPVLWPKVAASQDGNSERLKITRAYRVPVRTAITFLRGITLHIDSAGPAAMPD